MQLRHALHRRATNPPATDSGKVSIGERVPRVHRMGAIAVALTISAVSTPRSGRRWSRRCSASTTTSSALC